MNLKSLIEPKVGSRLTRIRRTQRHFAAIIVHVNLYYGLKIDYIPKKNINNPTELSFSLLKSLNQLLRAYTSQIKELSEFLEISAVNDYEIDEGLAKQLVIKKRAGGTNQRNLKSVFSACA